MHIGSNKKQMIMAGSSPTVNSSSKNSSQAEDRQQPKNSQDRPDGKKKEIHKLRQQSRLEAIDYLMQKKKEADAEKALKKDERWQKSFALQEERIRIEKEKFEFMRELEEDKIMSMDLSTMSAKQQKHYEGRQNDILARRRKN